jgi:hypothetical protein
MKAACFKIEGVSQKSEKRTQVVFENRTPADHLRVVGRAFVQAQETRELADYDLSFVWTREDLSVQISQVRNAFQSWNAVRHHLEAQKFLVLMLEPKQRTARVS